MTAALDRAVANALGLKSVNKGVYPLVPIR